MKRIREGVAGLVVFSMLMGLFFASYVSIHNNYGLPDASVVVNGVLIEKSIGQRLSELNIVEGFDDMVSIFEQGKFGSIVDILGALATSGLGLLQTLLGVFTFPFEIVNILEQHYALPPVLFRGVLALMVISITFIILSAKTKGDL